MKISFVSFEYQPIKTPQSLRWQKLLSHLAEARPVSVRVFNAPASIDSPFHDINFLSSFEEEVFSAFPHRVKKRTVATVPTHPSKKSPNTFMKWIKSAVKERLPFDKSFLWAFKSRTAFINFLERDLPDVVISSSPPFGAMILAWFAKRHYKKNIKWVCDLGDPWSFASDRKLGPIMRTIIGAMEKYFLSSADHIIVTNNRTKSEYLKILDVEESRISVIYQGADTNRNEEPLSAELAGDYVYTGTFYKNIREPHALFEAFSLSSRNLTVAGNIDPIFFPEKKSDRIAFIGNLGERDVKKLQRSAAALIFIDNFNSTQLPGKLFEYVATGRPVICIGVADDSPVNEVEFLDYPIVFCSNDTEDISRALEKVDKIGLQDYFGELNVSWKGRANQLGRIIDELY